MAERQSATSWLQRWGSLPMWIGVWTPIAVITVLHYLSPHSSVWMHNVLRRLYYLPIIYAAFRLGWRGGMGSATVVSLAYGPHAFFHLAIGHRDPGNDVDKMLEFALYQVVGFLVGRLAEQLERRREQLEATLEEREQLTNELVRAGRLSALGEVVAGIAHEIKNPLHALQGTAEVVDPLVPNDAPERRLWELHVSELQRLERVSARFLSFAAPESPASERVDLREVAERASSLTEADARQHDIVLELVVPEQPAWVQGDQDQLAQVLLNLCLNARRAIGEQQGRIRVCVSAGEHEHVVHVENDGPPLDEAELERLFDPFYGHDQGGTGLGLSIAARLVQQHMGHLDGENAGLGVRFSVRIPAVADGAA